MSTATTKPAKVPPGFERRQMKVNGADVVLFTGGAGDPLLFLHGAGTLMGFRFAAPWARKFKVILPYHPGFGESGDSATIWSIDDYVLHYLELMDQLDLAKIHLVGLSMGGWIAATLATRNGHRLNRLVLVAPAGLRVPEHPTLDLFRLKPDEIPAHLAHNLAVLAPHVPDPHGPEFLDFIVNDYREMSSFARIAWERPYDPNLAKWLHRIGVPTLLLYGRQDRVTPWQQSETWAKLIGGARVEIIDNAGHLVLDEQEAAPLKILDFLS